MALYIQFIFIIVRNGRSPLRCLEGLYHQKNYKRCNVDHFHFFNDFPKNSIFIKKLYLEKVINYLHKLRIQNSLNLFI